MMKDEQPSAFILHLSASSVPPPSPAFAGRIIVNVVPLSSFELTVIEPGPGPAISNGTTAPRAVNTDARKAKIGFIWAPTA